MNTEGISHLVEKENNISLFQNYPNPFSHSTQITFKTDKNCKITIDLFDLHGNKITTLFDSFTEEGYHSFDWEADNLLSGVYIIRLQSEFTILQKRILIVD